MVLKDKMRSRIVDPKVLHKDLGDLFLSNYLVSEVREFYTSKERVNFYRQMSEGKTKPTCKKNWPVCYTALENEKKKLEPHSLCLTSQFVLSNFKIGHFFSASKNNRVESQEFFTEKLSEQKLDAEDLLMVRQRHVCDCIDKDFERMKSEVRVRISKQLSSTPHVMTNRPTLMKGSSRDINSTYIEFIKKRKEVNPASQEDQSDYSQSQSGHSKPSGGDITNFNNTRSF